MEIYIFGNIYFWKYIFPPIIGFFPLKPCFVTKRFFFGQATVPTNIKDDTMHAAAMRLDYILGNDRILPLSPVPAQVARDDTTLGLSDHLPLLHHLLLR